MLSHRGNSAQLLVFGVFLSLLLMATTLRVMSPVLGGIELPSTTSGSVAQLVQTPAATSSMMPMAAGSPVIESATLPVVEPVTPTALASNKVLLFCADVSQNEVLARTLGGGPWTVIAGSGSAGYAGDGGAATAAQLDSPTGLAFDAQGNLYIADSGNHAVRRVDPSGTITTVVGTGFRGFSGDWGPATGAALDTPAAVAIGPDGAVYIADKGNNRIRRVDGAGVISTVAGSGELSLVAGSGGFGFSGDGGWAVAAQLSGPEGILVGREGDLYIADTGNDRVRHVDVRGIITTIAGSGLNGSFGDGGPATSAGMTAPVGLAINASGRLYISERDGQVIRRLEGGILNRVAGNGSRGNQAAQLNDPGGLAIAGGTLYLAEIGAGRVRMVAAAD